MGFQAGILARSLLDAFIKYCWLNWASLVSVLKNPSVNAGDVGSIFGSGRFPGEGNGNQLQYFCLENPIPGRLQFMGLQELVMT